MLTSPVRNQALVVQPKQFDEVAKFDGKKIDAESLTEFIGVEAVPYFGEINQDILYDLYDFSIANCLLFL